MTTPTHRELLEGAARAAGIEVSYHHGCGDSLELVKPRGFQVYWNPLTDDGDALRLAVKLGISITPYPIYAEDGRHSVHTKQRRHTDTLRKANPTECIELYGDDAMAATRLAITRAAYEISKEMR